MALPYHRFTDWTPGVRTGVPGGIPTSRTNFIDATSAPYNCDPTGVADSWAGAVMAINAAIAGGAGVHGVAFPAGEYRFNSQLTLGASFSGKTLRGAGMWLTVFKCNVNTGLVVGASDEFSTPTENPSDSIITDGLSEGSTVITVGSTQYTNVGDIALISFDDDDTIPVLSVYGYERTMKQAVRIVSKTATTFEIFPPLRDYHFPRGARLTRGNAVASGIGLEDLTVDCDPHPGAYACVRGLGVKDSWFLRVRCRRALNYLLDLANTLNCEVRECWISDLKGAGTNGAGLLMTAWQSLIEDNVIYNAFPVVEVNNGSGGNVIAYNFGGEDQMWNANHGGTNSYNLYEGNNWGYLLCDGYFAGQWRLTLFRNRNNGLYGINLRRLNRETSAVENVVSSPIDPEYLGLPNMGNTLFTGTAQLSAGDPWFNYDGSTKRVRKWVGVLTARSTDYAGVITFEDEATAIEFRAHGDISVEAGLMAPGGWGYVNFLTIGARAGSSVAVSGASTPLPAEGAEVVGVPSPAGLQERDLDVGETLYQSSNYARSNGVTSPVDAAAPESLFRSEKPSFFGALSWPPYGGAASYDSPNRIPAEIRFNGGEVEPDPGGGETPPVGWPVPRSRRSTRYHRTSLVQ